MYGPTMLLGVACIPTLVWKCKSTAVANSLCRADTSQGYG